MATADFKINTSVQADRGYDATNGEAITLTLENAPAIDVYKVVYSIVTASDGAPAITFSPGSGQPATPTGNVTFTTTGSGFHSYLIQCQVNDGKRQTDRGLVVDAGYTKQRMIVIRGVLTNLRKTVPAETTQYGSDGWSVALNELAEAIENGSVGGISTTEPIVTYGAAPTIPNAVDLTAITTTVAAASTTVQPVAVRLNSTTNDTVLDVFSLRRSTTHASNGATGIGARMFVELEDSAGNIDSAAQHVWDYLDATSTSEDARYTIRLQVAGSLTDVLSLRGTTIRVPVLAGGGSRVVTVDNNGDFGAAAASGLDANAHVLEDATIALGAYGVPMRAAPSTVGFIGVACAPISLTHKTAAAAGVTEGLRIVQQINAGGVGNPGVGGEAVKLAFALPNGSGAETLAASVRGEWTTVIGGGTSKLVLATALAGTETDRATLGGTGLWRWHAYGAGRILSDASGNLTSTAITFTEVQTALAAASGDIAVNSQKITGLANGSSASDAAAFGQIGTAVNAAVSGTANTLAKFTGANVVGDSGITDDGTTVNTTRVVTFTGTAVGSTQTRGTTITNTTVSGTQYTRQHGFTAFYSDGTQWNFGSRLEPVSAAHARLIWYYGSGAGVPSSEILRLDSQDDNFGALIRGPVFAASNTGGYRFDNANNRGGLKYDSGSDYIYLESYNGKDLRLRTGADSGGSGGTDRLTITTTGATTWTSNAATITRMQWGTVGVNYRDLTPKVLTTTDATVTDAITLAMADNSAAWWEVEAYCYITTDASKHAYFHWRGYFNRNGGAPVRDYHAAQTADQVIGGWGTPPSIAITAGAPGANDVSVQVTGLAATNIKWTVIARYHVTTTSA